MDYIFDSTIKYYKATPKPNPRDLVEIEVGDSLDSSQFFPQVKIKRWDNEVNASFRLNHDHIPGNITYSLSDNKITWQKGQWKAVFYDKPEASDEGGYEFEVHVPKKPPVNYLDFTINNKELEYFYQPALTQEEIDNGASRPENVVGSYAVYYKNCPANYVGGKEYKVGKAFHIYRPHATDSAGNSTWGDVVIDEVAGTMRISVPQEWLNNAVYPVIVDPTFGYGSVGGSFDYNSGSAKYIVGSKFSGSAGTLTSLSGYIRVTADAGRDRIKLGVYTNSTNTLLVKAGAFIAGTGSYTWLTQTVADTTISAVDYDLVVFDYSANWDVRGFKYDAGSTGQGIDYNSSAYTDFPASSANFSRVTNKYSIYATYTAGGGEVPTNHNLLLLGVGS